MTITDTDPTPAHGLDRPDPCPVFGSTAPHTCEPLPIVTITTAPEPPCVGCAAKVARLPFRYRVAARVMVWRATR